MHTYHSQKFLLQDADVAVQVDRFLNSFYLPHEPVMLYNWRVIGYVSGVAGEVLITVHKYDARSTGVPDGNIMQAP